MFIPHEGPGTWQSFLKRKDNVGLTIMEARQKYLKEQLLFESYINTLNTVNTTSPSVAASAAAAGGPPKRRGVGGGASDWAIEFKVNTAYNITKGYNNVPNPTTRLNMNFSTTDLPDSGNPFADGNVWNGDVTIDWGDGTVETKTGYDVGGTNTSNTQANWYGRIGLVQHDYATDGEYIVKIKGPGAYYLRFMWTPLVDLIKYDPSLTEDFRCLFAYMPLAATQNFEGDISNWTIPAGKSLACLASCYNNSINVSQAIRDYGCALNFSNWDISGITSLKKAFTTSNGFQDSQIANWAVPPTCTDLEKCFYGLAYEGGGNNAPDASIATLDVSNWDTSGVEMWVSAFEFSNWGGTGANSLDFSGLNYTKTDGLPPGANDFTLQNAFRLLSFEPYNASLPAIPDWNYGGDASIGYNTEFPGFGSAVFNAHWFGFWFPLSKADFGTSLIGWANNPDLTINATMDVTIINIGLSDFDYSADANVAAALTTLQNTKGWTLVGFTF